MINAPLRSATCRIAAPRSAAPRNATQRSDFPAASAPGWPENHPITPRGASHRNATRRNSTLTLKGNDTCKPQ
jgi:hypothetical protein